MPCWAMQCRQHAGWAPVLAGRSVSCGSLWCWRRAACRHFGMLAAARWIKQQTLGPMEAALAANPGEQRPLSAFSCGSKVLLLPQG